MKLDVFAIPAHGPAQGGGDAQDALNRHLANARVLSVERAFVADGANSFWSVCVLSQPGARDAKPAAKPRVDYREVLGEADFGVYLRLRELRKTLAERDGVPPYAVFTNEQLAEIARRRADSVTALREIDGVGEARVEKYATSVLGALRALAAAPAISEA